MTVLVVSTKTIHSVDYKDFEDEVRDRYGVDDYNFVADVECGNDTAITLSDMKKEALLEDELEDLETFRNEGEYDYLYRVLLQDMINNGVAPEGDYVIEVSW